jgi:hypothetical protein
MEHRGNILPRRPAPIKQNDYLRAERPLSYQPRFTPVTTQPVNNYGFPEPGIQVRILKPQATVNAYLYSFYP